MVISTASLVPARGSNTLKGVNFSYEITRIKKKQIAPPGSRYLDLRVYYRKMVYRGVGLFRECDLKTPERFILCCHDLIRSVLKANPFLVQALDYEGSIE